jgi:hypothetical protein
MSKEGEQYTYNSRPEAGNGHFGPLAVKVHGKALCQDAHADLAHGVGRLSAEEAAVDGRAHDDDAATAITTACTACAGRRRRRRRRRRVRKVRQSGLHDSVKTLWINVLHELEAAQRGLGHGGPEDGAGVVDEDVYVAVRLDGAVDETLDALGRPHIDLQCRGLAAGLDNLTGDGGDGRVGRVWVRGKGSRRRQLGRVADRLGGDDDCVTVGAEVNGNLSADAARGTDDEGNGFGRGHV